MQNELLFPLTIPSPLPIKGISQTFPVNRVFCIGRNYADHAAEMGVSVDKQAPFYFLKSAVHVMGNKQTIPFALKTNNLHHEVELVVCLDKPAFELSEQEASQCIYGYAVGVDLTRRDLQAQAKEKSLPWDAAKDFEQSAVVGMITPASEVGNIANASILLTVNGEKRQEGNTAEMIWSVAELIAYLSGFYHLQAGDIIFTGTPKGVGALQKGDVLLGRIEGLEDLSLRLAP